MCKNCSTCENYAKKKDYCKLPNHYPNQTKEGGGLYVTRVNMRAEVKECTDYAKKGGK